MSYLNEPSVLWNLKTRYQTDDIYTCVEQRLTALQAALECIVRLRFRLCSTCRSKHAACFFPPARSYVSGILIAVNPFAPMPHLYGLHMMEQYRGLALGELSPHVYAIADEAFRLMRKERKSQSILVGAGSSRGMNAAGSGPGSRLGKVAGSCPATQQTPRSRPGSTWRGAGWRWRAASC